MPMMHGRHPRLLAWYWKLPLLAAVRGGVVVYAYHLQHRSLRQQASAQEAAVAPTAPSLTPDQSQRQFLWDVEHHGLVLSKHGFRALADALSRADAQRLLALLAPDFTGQVLHQPREVRV